MFVLCFGFMFMCKVKMLVSFCFLLFAIDVWKERFMIMITLPFTFSVLMFVVRFNLLVSPLFGLNLICSTI